MYKSKKAQERIKQVLDAAQNCPHPPEEQVKMGYGIFCKKCQIRTGYISQAEGEALILEGLKQMGLK